MDDHLLNQISAMCCDLTITELNIADLMDMYEYIRTREPTPETLLMLDIIAITIGEKSAHQD